MPTTHSNTPAVDTASPSVRQTELHVVAHTHWDREWYHSAERFQQRLVALIDAILDSPTPSTFLLDGQAIVISDYLAARPDRRAQLELALQQGEIEVGPWYVLADNLIPSGEAIVRNLQAGRRVLSALGANIPAVAYCPDSFGHPATLPLIARGFGLTTAIVWRGLGGKGHPSTDTMWWEAPDGTRLLTWHLPRDGYEFGSALPTKEAAARERIARIDAELIERATTNAVLLPNGADHHALQTDLDRAIEVLNQVAAADGRSIRFTRSMLGVFTIALHEAVEKRALPVVAGELRNSYGYTWTLSGTLATRAADKRRNAKLERLLLHDVEPWCALTALRNASTDEPLDGRIGRQQLPPLLAHAWESLLETHPHDTLCGCSIDDVAFAMRRRQRSVSNQSRGLRADAMALLLDHDVVEARTRPIHPDAPAPLVIRNRSARPRSGVGRITVVQTLADVAVGPGSASRMSLPTRLPDPPAVRGMQTQFVSARTTHMRRESPQHYPDNDLVRVHEMLAWIPEIPALGVRVIDPAGPLHSPAPPNPVSIESVGDALHLTNGIATLIVSMGGATLQVGNRVLRNFVSVESTRDVGDSYTPSLRGESIPFELVRINRGLAGPLRASVEMRYVHPDGGVNVRVTLSLDAGSSHAVITVRGTNSRYDHRLRLRIATGVIDPSTYADAAFGPVLRQPIEVDERASRMELPPSTMPLHRWISVSRGTEGVALISDGLAEGEAGDGFVAVTLLRAIDELSRNDLPERPGHAGWPASIPDAQSLGEFRARFALVLHGAWSTDSIDAIERASDDVLLPLVGESWRDLTPDYRTIEGVELRGAALRCQAFMPAQDGVGAIARIVNLSDAMASGRVVLPELSLEYCLAALNESPSNDWQPAHGELPITVPPRGALTLRLRARP